MHRSCLLFLTSCLSPQFTCCSAADRIDDDPESLFACTRKDPDIRPMSRSIDAHGRLTGRHLMRRRSMTDSILRSGGHHTA